MRAFLFVLLCTACAPERTVTTENASGPEVTWHRDIRPLVETHCVACHAPGRSAPMSLVDFSAVSLVENDVVDAVTAHRMPPFLPDPGCRALANVRVMTTEERARFAHWQRLGFPEGRASDHVPPVLDDTGPSRDPDVVTAMPVAFTPEAGGGDTQEEFALDVEFARDTWITASQVQPGAPSIVHHATLFLDETGLPEHLRMVGGWAPGQRRFSLPEDAALRVPAGARLRLFVHYSTVAIAPAEPVPSDVTTVMLWTLPDGVEPRFQAFFDPVSQSELALPAGAPHVEIEGLSALESPEARIIGLVPHMHLLGVGFRSALERADGTRTCLVDEPRYAFLHQSVLMFEVPVDARPGDQHRMTCVYDNSEANQPIVHGARKTPVDVTWGDASTDEMCMDILLRMRPL